MNSLLKDLGILRISLILFALIAMWLRPPPGTDSVYSGWEMIPTLVAPAMTPIIFMVLLFDFMMCRVRMSDASVRSKFRRVGYTELIVAFLLLILWLPYFLAIGS